MSNTEAKLEFYEAEELAAKLLGIQGEDIDSEEVEEKLAVRWGIAPDAFHEIAQGLFGMTSIGVSPLTNTALIGFSVPEENHSRWIAKYEITSEFIGLVLQWMCENQPEKIENGSATKTITLGEEVKYEIVVRRAMPKKPEGYLSDDLQITDIKKHKDATAVFFKYMKEYSVMAQYPIGNDEYSHLAAPDMPDDIFSQVDDLISNEFKREIFEYVQSKLKEK